ncbi:FecR family protein [Chitinophaga sp. 30R24]|uniref:FecR family protein n=1 Tax=Chitinophaga sp. 30R24 TaxID=3248838 RepID=UPI003B900E68
MEVKKLLQRYVAGKCTPEEQLLVEEWYRQTAAQRTTNASPLLLEEMQQSVWERLQAMQTPGVRRMKFYQRPAWKIAALALLLLGATYLLSILLFPSPVVWKEAYAANNKSMQLQLPDGSSVWLNAGSRLRYPAHFAHIRQIELVSGEARLQVKQDPVHPFKIRSGAINTAVLGTIFNVRFYHQLPFIQVTVQEGKVAVSNATAMVTLLANERATLYTGQQQFVKDTLDAAGLNAWMNNQLLFSNERLDMIAALLENKFNVQISFADPSLPDYKITAGFGATDDLEEVLDALSLANRLAWQKKGNNIVFSKQ